MKKVVNYHAKKSYTWLSWAPLLRIVDKPVFVFIKAWRSASHKDGWEALSRIRFRVNGKFGFPNVQGTSFKRNLRRLHHVYAHNSAFLEWTSPSVLVFEFKLIKLLNPRSFFFKALDTLGTCTFTIAPRSIYAMRNRSTSRRNVEIYQLSLWIAKQ